MVYRLIVFATRKPSITHEQFKTRYENHIRLVEEICGDAMPLEHNRWYPKHEGPDDKPVLLAGEFEEMFYDAIVQIVFEDEAAYERFYGALSTEEAKKRIEGDEDGFWDRGRMKVVVVGDVGESRR